jgi:hypothetical protein
MNTRSSLLTLILSGLLAIPVIAQQYPNTPPKVSPMPMKPEMTEIWEPEVPMVTPAKRQGQW